METHFVRPISKNSQMGLACHTKKLLLKAPIQYKKNKELPVMALFDLRCKDCQTEFKKMIPYAKLAEVTCPSCGSGNHERVYLAHVKGPISSGAGGSSSGGGFTCPGGVCNVNVSIRKMCCWNER
ncbi:MAG: zinc ribbon domain-containing protein [Bacillales bacterium]